MGRGTTGWANISLVSVQPDTAWPWTFVTSPHSCEVGIVSILQMRKLKLRVIKEFAQSLSLCEKKLAFELKAVSLQNLPSFY